jgi:hypothetical protein
MKILALVEQDETTGLIMGKPIKIYNRGKSVTQIDAFFKIANQLIKLENNKDLIQQRDEANQNAEIQRLSAMGMMHISQFDALFEMRVNEIITRTKNNIWLEAQKAKFTKGIIRIAGKIGLKFLTKK